MMTSSERQKLQAVLQEGAASLRIDLQVCQAEALIQYLDLLLTWNRKINLTSVVSPEQAVEIHLLDSLAAAPAVAACSTVLDLGAGGGLPGIPLALLNGGQSWTLVDTVGKKVGFLKSAIAHLGLDQVQAQQVYAQGLPDNEHLPICQGVISRAFKAPLEWLSLAQHYVAPGGWVVAMLGHETQVPSVLPAPFHSVQLFEYRLPFSGIQRRVARFECSAEAAPGA